MIINTLVQALIKPAKTRGGCSSWQQLSGVDRRASVFLVNDIACLRGGKHYWSVVPQPVEIDVHSADHRRYSKPW